MNNETTTIFNRAKKRIDAIKTFYNHVFVYCIINAVFLFLWLFIIRNFYADVNNEGFKNWIDANFLFCTGVWTLVLIFHGLRVFFGKNFKKIQISIFKNWEERKIKEFMDAEERFEHALKKDKNEV